MGNIICEWCGEFRNDDEHTCLSGFVHIKANPHSIMEELLIANELIMTRLLALEQKIEELKRS